MVNFLKNNMLTIFYRGILVLLCMGIMWSSCKPDPTPTLSADLPQIESQLIHLVFLQLQDNLGAETVNAFEAAVGQLGAIETVHGFSLGRRAATPDPRARIDYSHVLQMAFRNEADLQAYRKDERHLRIRQELMPLLSGPPVVCDYWVGE